MLHEVDLLSVSIRVNKELLHKEHRVCVVDDFFTPDVSCLQVEDTKKAVECESHFLVGNLHVSLASFLVSSRSLGDVQISPCDSTTILLVQLRR